MTGSAANPLTRLPVAAPRAWRRGGLTNELVLAAVGLLVVLVSIPELRQFVVRSNDHDARSCLRLFGALAVADGRSEALPLGEVLDDEVRHRLPDARVVAVPGAELAYHGYFFGRAQSSEGPVLIAWPQEAGRSGGATYALSPTRGLLRHPNADARWSGLERPPVAVSLERWPVVREP